MEKKTITLTKDNYNQYLPLEPEAFSFAELGAMGCPGEILIIDKGSIYSFYVYDFEDEIINTIIPVLFESIRNDPPSLEWHKFYLGMGNHLWVNDSIYDKFNSRAIEYKGQLGNLYQNWINIVLEITMQ
ncbi:MAG: hypothetical protein IKA04_07025 [Alistipes sp.]|nr:hypothetical protein [Alistipes sp.]